MIKFSSLPQQNISFLNAFQSYSEQIIKSGFFANLDCPKTKECITGIAVTVFIFKR
jgi:hypothetical protein